MPSINRPQSVVTINTRQSIYGGTGTVDLEVEGGTISLTT